MSKELSPKKTSSKKFAVPARVGWAMAMAIGLLVLNLLGAREHTAFLSGTQSSWPLLGLLYAFFYFATYLLAAPLVFSWLIEKLVIKFRPVSDNDP